MNKNLHVYANGVVEWIVAESPSDAVKVWEETVGEIYDTEDCGEFEQELDSKELFIWASEDCTARNYKTCREWANEKGRCYLCSTEY